jgi:hypothetical protein
MDPSAAFELFIQELKVKNPDLPLDYTLETAASEFEEFYGSAVQILQKDGAFFDTERKAFGINLSELERDDGMWKHIQMCTIASFFHGDIKTKFGKILTTVKSIWGASGQENDGISQILNDEASENHLESLYNFIMETRIAKVFLEIMEQVDVSNVDLDIQNPAELLEILKDPQHPILQKFIGKVQALLKEKLTSGSYTQNQMTAEIEGIKAKVQSLFGSAMNDMMGIGGRRGTLTSSTLVSNSPEARRQRMIARLQRKQHEKNRH